MTPADRPERAADDETTTDESAAAGAGGQRSAPQGDADIAATVGGLTDILVKSVRALGAAGEPDLASRLAAKAWWVLKAWPRQAERVNGTMHYLARLPQPDEASRTQ